MNDRLSAATPVRAWRYATPAVLLHWTLALLIAGMLALGWYMMSVEDEPGSDRYFMLHKSIGLVMFVLVLVRFGWRLRHPPAPLPASVPAWEARLSLLTQRALYGCMFLLPLLGFIGASYSKEGVQLFGVALPVWVVPDHDMAERFFGVHGAVAWLIVALVLLHAAGGLKHLLLDRDGVFQRMWFR